MAVFRENRFYFEPGTEPNADPALYDAYERALKKLENTYGPFVEFQDARAYDWVHWVERHLPADAYFEVLFSPARGRYESRVVIGENIGFGRSKKSADGAILQAFLSATGIFKNDTLYVLDPFHSLSAHMYKYNHRPRKAKKDEELVRDGD